MPGDPAAVTQPGVRKLCPSTQVRLSPATSLRQPSHEQGMCSQPVHMVQPRDGRRGPEHRRGRSWWPGLACGTAPVQCS